MKKESTKKIVLGRKQLSMKRLHILAANFCIEQLEKTKDMKRVEEMNKTMLDFMKYCWEHKEDESLFTISMMKGISVQK